MNHPITDGVRLGIPQIADIANVTTNAVTNWRKRHDDFPTPVVSSPSGMLFDAGEIERWLIENGKLTSRIPAANVLWPFVDSVRHQVPRDEIGLVVLAALVYLAVNRNVAAGLESGIPRDTLWTAVEESPDEALAVALKSAATVIEDRRPRLAGTMTRGFSEADQLDGADLRRLLEMFDRVTTDEEQASTPGALLDQSRQRLHGVDRWSETTATPESLEQLFARLADGAGSVFDPACGEAGALVLTGRRQAFAERHQPAHLTGWEINDQAAATARARSYLYGVDVDIRTCNSLTTQPVPTAVDVAIADPPLRLRDWGTADDYVSPRWRYGPPTPASADMAWLQVALESLGETGRAYVLLGQSSLSSGGAEAKVRSRMLDAGVIDAVVELPSRLRRDTSISLALWALRPPRPEPGDVLIVDASTLGTPGRSTVTLDVREITALADLLIARRNDDSGLTPADPRIELALVEREEIDNDELDPARYRSLETVSHEELRRQRQAAVDTVLEASKGAADALSQLLERLEEIR